MKILAFDGTAKAAAVALFDGERALAAYTVDNGLTQSELLLPMAEHLLASTHTEWNDVELFAVTEGPGSFTGVRIGTSLVAGIAFGRNIPCVGVSTLEALAENLSGLPGVILPVMDARRAQVYTATFISDGESLERKTPDRAISLAELAEELRSAGAPVYLVGDGYSVAYKALTDAGIKLARTPELLVTASAVSVARVALRKFQRGEYVTDRELVPTYLRLPQAERERLEKIALEKKEKQQ